MLNIIYKSLYRDNKSGFDIADIYYKRGGVRGGGREGRRPY
jgi:hypothetical protein